MRLRFFMIFAIVITSIIITSCSGSSGGNGEEITEILTLGPDCRTDNMTMRECCASDCQSFCKENDLPMSKNDINEPKCLCWCG